MPCSDGRDRDSYEFHVNLLERYESLLKHHFKLETECEMLRKILQHVKNGSDISTVILPEKTNNWEYDKK
jgi:hypothetical protein